MTIQDNVIDMKGTVYLESLGCAKNQVDSEIMLTTLLRNGLTYVGEPAEAEYIVVNTCGFLSSAVTESVERILALAEQKKTGNCKKLIVAGCLSARYRESLMKELPEIDGIIGTNDYTAIIEGIEHDYREYSPDIWLPKKPLYSRENYKVERLQVNDRHYSYLKIAEGCSNACSFCNIPKLRGPFVSRPSEGVVDEFKRLLRQDVREVNLISQDTSSYGVDLPEKVDLHLLVRRLLESSPQEDFWLRIFYAYPNNFPLELFDVMHTDRRLTPYLDMPLQHISDNVLDQMNRKITRKEIEGILATAYRKVSDLSLRSTFIVGFPNESEADFRELLTFVEEGHFEHIGVFAYSAEDNTRSYRLGDPISPEEKEERKNRLMEAQQQVLLAKNQARVGNTYRVLLDGFSEETDLLLQGRTAYQGVEVDGKILINEGTAEKGEFCSVEIIEAHPYDLVGKIV